MKYIPTLSVFIVTTLQSVAQRPFDEVASIFNPPFTQSLIQTEDHLQWVSDFGPGTAPVQAFHAGEDWAGPINTPLWTMSNATVVTNDSNIYQGNYIRLRYDMPYGGSIWHDYLHSNRRSLYRPGEIVPNGFHVLRLGNTGFSTGPHVHTTMYTDPSIGINENVYLNGISTTSGNARPKLTADRGRKYVSPQLIQEDWLHQVQFKIEPNWPPKYISTDVLIMNWQCYVRDNDRNIYTIQEAVESGLIRYGILTEENGIWYRYRNVNDGHADPNEVHGILANKACTFILTQPAYSNRSQKYRAMQDIYNHVAIYGDLIAEQMDGYNIIQNTNWHPSWNSHRIFFYDRERNFCICQQATSIKNPIVRYVTMYYKGKWSSWQKVDNTIPSYMTR